MTPHNPITVRISHSAHVTINTYTILRVTPQHTTSTLLSYITRPLFTQSITSSLDCEVDSVNSFVILWRVYPFLRSRCCLQSRLFYATGDLQGIDIQRHLYLRTMTNKRFEHRSSLEECFDIPPLSFEEPMSQHPYYYDIDCLQQELYITVRYDYDRDGREILVVELNCMGSLPLRKSRKGGRSIQTLGQDTYSYLSAVFLSKEVLMRCW